MGLIAGRARLRKTRLALWVLVALLSLWLVAWAVAARLAPEPAPHAAHPISKLDLPLDLQIAPRAEALTFARFLREGKLELMLVSRVEVGQVHGLAIADQFPALPADPLEVFNALGFEQLAALGGVEIAVPMPSLQLPFDGTGVQVAAGINYPEHGREVAANEVFLFPKTTRPAHFLSAVGTHGGLLDYEIELGFVALAPLKAGEPPRLIGLVLASGYTDRAALLRGIDLGNVESGRGFTRAKSQPDLMPIGSFLVVPQDPDAFVRKLSLRLSVNGQQRQHAKPQLLVWDWRRILAETFERAPMTWAVGAEQVALPVRSAVIPAATVFLSGTPEGVVVQAPTARQKFLGVTEMVFTLQWANLQAVVEPMLRESYRAGYYLQPGDEVVMHADRLGVIRNTIVEGAGPVPMRSSR